MHDLKLSLLFLLLISLFACDNSLELENDGALSVEERAVMEECQAAEILTKKQIEENLIGNWRLVGYSCGFCAFSVAPTASADFQSDRSGRFIYNGGNGETAQDFTWSIIDTLGFDDNPTFLLQTEPEIHQLDMTVFCQDYMFNSDDNVIADLPIFIYAKQ